ncbi:hypothetical protein PHYSODRAFT_563579 [Phytophthora sojae]|uniref:FYVE-type domain-containing protein n=1 Tax=Phytophthora sojae (strain P6497) TaxID=1094619 RepID=G5A154_PHYSP|nr:hypothetical protein PHYSODRAFT_563579 [Phytophthora sojae]EGZ10656.1 hypothetical protein PHYSODRAFT_563579 [Phytophthora sojae]|eukprot:XP_009533401.1 hypothetical protein PHYSODRAFT_563579 [Phytophthora sojae]
MARGFGASSSRVGGPSASSVSNGSESLGASRVWTPLRENHFEPPLLSSRERAYLVRKACEAAQELVERARSAGGPIAWRHVEKNNGVQIYAGSPRASASGSAASAASMCGVTSVPGTVKEVASLFQLGSTRQMKEFARAHREWFYDGVVLHTLAPRTKEKPLHQVTAKWMVVQMPSGVPHRDFCYLECQDKFIDARGRKGWVLGQHSIKLPGCDDLKREFGLVRGSLYHSGFVVVESAERAGHVDVIHLVQLNLKEHTQVPMNLLRARVLFVAQVRNMLRSKRLNEQRYLSDLELVPRKYRARCAVCQDSFSLLLLRKLNCRKCGEVVCAACSKEFPIENRNFAATNGGDEVRKLRICMHCFQTITNAPKPTTALVEPPHSSTMSMSFLGYHDDDRRASYMTSRVGHHGPREGENEAPKIFLQSMRREKPSRRRMSSTSPIPGFGADMPPSTSRHRTRGEQDSDLYERSQRYQQQQHDHGRSHNHRTSQRMRPSDFRPSQSLSLDDPIARGEGRYTLQMPGPPPVQSPASIFDRPAPSSSRRQPSGLPRSNSSDMLLGTGSRNMSNFSRLQELSSRERLEQLQRQGNYMSRSSMDYRAPDAYMSALQQASRDKRDFDAAPPMCAAPPSDFGAYGAHLQVTPPDFGAYESSSLDEPDVAPPLDMSALTTSMSAVPIELNSSTGIKKPVEPASSSRDGGRERELLRRREREVEQRRESTSSDSSASSIDIDTYDDTTNLAVVPPIAEQKQDARSAQHSVKAHVHDTDEDSEASMGASDDEEGPRVSAKIAASPSRLPPRRPLDDSAEETKAHEFAGTPALPPPSPSAHTVTRQILERPSIANSTAGSLPGDAVPTETEGKTGVEIIAPKESEAVEEDLIDHDPQLQRSKVEDLVDHELQRSKVEDLIDHELQRSKVEDLIDHEYQQTQSSDDGVTSAEQRVSEVGKNSKNYSFQERYGHLETDADLLNTAGCDMNYLDADMRQFHDQSLFIRQSRDGSAPSDVNGVTPPYERMPTSPKGENSNVVDLVKPSQPTIDREGTFALDLRSTDGSMQSWNSRNSSANHVALDARTTGNEVSSPTAASSTRTEDRFATNSDLVSGPVNSVAEDLVFHRESEVPRPSDVDAAEEQDAVVPPPVIPVALAGSQDDGIVQTSGDDVSESRSRASSRASYSSLISSDGRRSSTCSMGLDAVTPPATPPAVSPVAIGRLSATSASSPVAPTLDPARSSEAPSSSGAPPAYVPDRFRTMEQLQQSQQQEQQKVDPAASTTPRQSTDSNGTLDNFQLNFSASFNAHQEQKPHPSESGVVDGLSHLPPPPTDDRNRASSTGSNDVQVLRYQSVGSSVLDTVPDTARLSISDDDDSENENVLLSARKLYGKFGNTKQLSRLGGNRPGFQHTLSQIQQSFDQLSDSEDDDDEDTPAAPRR